MIAGGFDPGVIFPRMSVTRRFFTNCVMLYYTTGCIFWQAIVAACDGAQEAVR